MSFSPSRLPGGAAVPRFGSSVMNGWSCSHQHHHHRFRRTAGLKSSSHRRPKRASAKTPTVFASSSFQQRDLCEGNEGEDVEILQRDLVEEGLLDQKHANGYVAFLDIFFFFRWTFTSRCRVFVVSLVFKYLYENFTELCTFKSLSLYMYNIMKTTNATQALQRPNDRGDRDASATVRFTRHRRMDRVGKVGVSRRDERNADDQRREASAGAADGEREEGAGKRADVLHERGEFG